MIRINLLPESYIRTLAQKRLRIHLIMLGCAAAAIAVVWWQLAWRQVDRIDRRVAAAAQNLAFERASGAALARAEAQCKKLAAAKALGEQVEEPLHPTIVLALISKLLPEQVALTKLSLEMVPVRETP